MFDFPFSGYRRDRSRELKIASELRGCGFGVMQMRSLEVRHLADILKINERIMAAVSGRNENNDRSIIIATDMRVVAIDYMPLFHSVDEISYGSIQGVTVSAVVLRAVVILHVSGRDVVLRQVKLGMAQQFADYVETRSIDLYSAAT